MASDLARLHRLLAGIFLFGSAGTGIELLLLGHTEDVWQLVPLALVPAGCAALLWMVRRPRPAALRVFQVVMALFVASGALGVLLHYRGNVEFEMELHPSASGWDLFKGAMTGATPALAPGTMALLGAVGFAYTYRHPATTSWREGSSVSGEKST